MRDCYDLLLTCLVPLRDKLHPLSLPPRQGDLPSPFQSALSLPPSGRGGYMSPLLPPLCPSLSSPSLFFHNPLNKCLSISHLLQLLVGPAVQPTFQGLSSAASHSPGTHGGFGWWNLASPHGPFHRLGNHRVLSKPLQNPLME